MCTSGGPVTIPVLDLLLISTPLLVGMSPPDLSDPSLAPSFTAGLSSWTYPVLGTYYTVTPTLIETSCRSFQTVLSAYFALRFCICAYP